jgi:hypothetical protein
MLPILGWLAHCAALARSAFLSIGKVLFFGAARPFAERKATLAIVIALLSPIVARADVLTFDDALSGNRTVNSYASGSWLVTASPFHTVTLPNGGVLKLVDNSTPYIASLGSGAEFDLTLRRTDDAPFSLVRFDAAELYLDAALADIEGVATPTDIHIGAMWPDGHQSFHAFTLDGIRDGAGGADDFQTFITSSELSGVSALTFFGADLPNDRDAGMALDNLVVTAVPEPSAAALLAVAMALGCVGCIGRRIRTRKTARIGGEV